MTDSDARTADSAPHAAVGYTADDEDARLAEFGYQQKLDRSVGTLASFAIGFATISATTAVFTGFGAGYLSSTYKDTFAFIVILVVLFAMPQGLFGRRVVERV